MVQPVLHRCWSMLLALALSTLSVVWAGSAHASDAVILDDTLTHLAMGRHVSVLEDASTRLGIDDILKTRPDKAAGWGPRASDELNFGYSASAFWLRGELLNQASTQTSWLLGMRYPLLDFVDIYVVWPDGRIQHHASGDRRAFASRSLKDRNFYFRLSLQRGERVQVYARVQSQGSLQVPFEVSTPAHTEQQTHTEQMLMGVYSGALLAMLTYNLLLGLSLRERTYLYYVVYIAMFGVAQATLTGIAYEYLWPHRPLWSNLAAPVFMGLAGWSLMLFSRQFLDIRLQAPRIDTVLRALQWFFLFVAATSFVLPYAWSIKLATFSTMVVPPLMLAFTAMLLRQGVRQARFFLWAFGGLLMGVALTSLQRFGYLPNSMLTEYGLQVGSMMELVTLSFALAHRVKIAQEENERLQRAHAAELEARVQARTRDLDAAMGQLTEVNERLQDMTERDALTGLKNRMFLAERLLEVWRHGLRWKEPVSVLMIDVDHFKRVNDEHGHLAGDEALRQVAHVIAQIVQRPGDHAVRYGGEEFLVLLPNTHLAGAAHVAENIRRKVEAMPLSYGDRQIPLTVSVGVACVNAMPEVDPQALISAADQMLYQAKQNGRNRCALHSEARGTAPPTRQAIKPGLLQPAPASSEQT